MLFGEKKKLAALGGVSGPTLFSALKDAWAEFSSRDRRQTPKKQNSSQKDIDKESISPELRGLFDILQRIRQRVLTNALLGGWTEWLICISIGLIVAAALSARLAGALIAAGLIAVLGAAFIFTWIWRARPSAYRAACLLDSKAGLHDRVSTAIYLGEAKNPSGMIQCQRDDAIARMTNVDARALFPIRAPASTTQVLALVLIAGGLLVYRINHKAPLIALLQSTVRSSLVQSVFSPMVQDIRKNLQDAIAMAALKPEIQADKLRPGDAMGASENPWQPNDEKDADAKDSRLDQGSGDRVAQQGEPPVDYDGSPSGDPQSQDGNKQAESNSQRQSSSQDSQSNTQSLTKSVIQSLKNMMSKQQSGDRRDSPKSGKSSQQTGGSPPSGPSDKNESNDARGMSENKDKSSETTGTGAGNQDGLDGKSKDQKDNSSNQVKAVPERVALEATGFKDQIRMRVDAQAGTSHLGVSNASPQAEVVINGDEQENIPARYRLYVQRYFEHVDHGKQ